MAKTYSEWYQLAESSVTSLAEITDAASPDDQLGTICNRSYWEGHAYDQIRQILLTLGPSPGSGASGSFTLNNDNTSNDAEDSYLYFSRGVAQYGNAYVRWNSGSDRLEVNYPLHGSGLGLGSSASRWGKLWSAQADLSETLNVSGAVTFGTTLGVTGLSTFGDVSVGGTLGVNSLSIDGATLTINADAETPETAGISVYRGAVDDSSDIRWNESETEWEMKAGSGSWRALMGVGDSEVITTDMFASAVYAGSGGNYGVAATVARSDHAHDGGTVGATGTDNESFTIDADWEALDDTDIELRFGSSSYRVFVNPDSQIDSVVAFQFSHSLTPIVNGGGYLGTTNYRWAGLNLSGPADIQGNLNVAGSTITLSGDVTIGAIADNLAIKGTTVTLDSDTEGNGTALIRVPIGGGYSHAAMSYNGSNWYLSHAGEAAKIIATRTGTEELTNKTLTSPIFSGHVNGDISVGGTVIANGDAETTSEAAYFEAGVSSGTKPAIWWAGNEMGQPWKVREKSGDSYPIALTTKTQTLTNKYLTTPVVSGGTFNSNPSFTGSPAFVANGSYRATFNVGADAAAPFLISRDDPGYTPSMIDDLDADRVDGIEGADILHATTPGGDYMMGRNLNLNGYSITGLSITIPSHASDHITGGSDALSGVLGTVSGVNNTTFRIDAASGSASTRLYLGQQSDFYMGIKSPSNNKMIGMGGDNVHLAPGGTGQHLGYNGNLWQRLWLSGQVNFTPTSTDPGDLQNGSLWICDAGQGNGGVSALKTRLNGNILRVINHNNKTDMTGSTGAWDVQGNITVTGSVDGRDVSTDGSKLDGIEAGADVTDSANVATAGAIMESDFPAFYGIMYKSSGGVYDFIDLDAYALSDHNHDSTYSLLEHNHDGSYAISSHDHSEFFRLDGTRALTANLDAGGHNLTNVGSVDGYDLSVKGVNWDWVWTQVTLKDSNWDTAYSWGDHDGLYSALGHTHSGYYSSGGGEITGEVNVSGGKLRVTGGYNLELANGNAANFNGSGTMYGITKFGTYLVMMAGGNDIAYFADDLNTYFGGDVRVSSGNGVILNAGTNDDKIYSSGSYLYIQSGGNDALAMDSSRVYSYHDFYVKQSKKIFLDWYTNTYITFNGSNILLYKNGSQVASW